MFYLSGTPRYIWFLFDYCAPYLSAITMHCVLRIVCISKDFKDFHFFKTNTLDRTEIAANVYVKVTLSKSQSK